MSTKSNELVSNKRATFNFEILETLEAGIVLQGTEIKSLRDNGGTLQEAYVKVVKNEVWLVGAGISPYRFGNIYNHEEKRERKLLLHTREIEHLKVASQEKGLTIIALSFYLKDGRVKVKLGIAKGKKLHDKRATIKERDEKKNMAKAIKESRR
jgi:SsrA-binding protein